MLFEFLRIWKETGDVFTDLSMDNQEEAKVLTPDLGNDDYLYVAQNFPFNNLYIRTGTTVNAVAGGLTIEYWDNKSWRSAVDVLDSTSVSGVTLARPGVVQFSPQRDFSWVNLSESNKNNAPTEIQSLTIYDCYWLRIKADNGITVGSEIQEIGYTFTDTQQLDNIDIEISEFYESFASGKTDWITEIMTASKMLLIDLKRQGLVVDRGQILRFDDVFMAGTYKTLELIYMNLGPSYQDKRSDMRSLYDAALNIKRFTVDTDSDGRVARDEIKNTIKRLVR